MVHGRRHQGAAGSSGPVARQEKEGEGVATAGQADQQRGPGLRVQTSIQTREGRSDGLAGPQMFGPSWRPARLEARLYGPGLAITGNWPRLSDAWRP